MKVEVGIQRPRPLRVLSIDVTAKICPALRIDPSCPVRQQHRNSLAQAHIARLSIVEHTCDRFLIPALAVVEHEFRQFEHSLHTDAARAEGALGAIEQRLRGRVVQINEV